MDWEVFKSLVGEISLALGGGFVIVSALSALLGKVWADRLMANVKFQHEQGLVKLRNMLETKIKEMEHTHTKFLKKLTKIYLRKRLRFINC